MGEEHFSSNVIPRNLEPQVDLQEKPLCVLCEFAIHVLEKETGILSNRTLDMAEHAVEMLCSYMPSTIGDKCIEFVQEYGDELIEIIIETELNPEQICGALTLCDMSSIWDASPVGAVYVLLVLPSGVNLEFMPKPVAQLDTAK